MLGIIASSGAKQLGEQLGLDSQVVDTQWGAVQLRTGQIEDRPVVCVARHGEGTVVPPHRVNYRANIAALSSVGCTGILATNAVGSLHAKIKPSMLCLADQILDFTKNRCLTFHEDEILCVDFTTPYCSHLQQVALAAAQSLSQQLHAGMVYACMEGPRFETAAEIRMLQILGADLVGMTAIPEAALAREKGLCYASLCVVTNLAAGVESHHPSSSEVTATMQESWDIVLNLTRAIARAYDDDPACPCHSPTL